MEGQESELTIKLKTGKMVTRRFVEEYVEGVFAAEQSGEQFPVKFNDLWPYGFTRKDHAWEAFLDMQPVEGEDYRILPKNRENSKRGQPEKNYAVTVRMAEHFCMVYNPVVRDIYIAIRKAFAKQRQSDPAVGRVLEAVASLVAKLEANEAAQSARNEAFVQAIATMMARIDAVERRQASAVSAIQRNLDGRLDPAERNNSVMTPAEFMEVIERVEYVPSDLAEWSRELVAYCRSKGYKYTGGRPRQFPFWLLQETVLTMGPLGPNARARKYKRDVAAKQGRQMDFNFGRDSSETVWGPSGN